MSEIPVYILCIETANAITSVAISKNGNCLAVKEIIESNKAADKLHLLTEDLLKEANLSFSQLHAIAISAGPGSYTGLRIAAAAAKGYCFALNIPLIAISTFEAMVIGIQERYHQLNFDEYMPMIDARRMEVFTSSFNKNGEIIKAFSSLIIDDNFENLLDKKKKYILFGNGAFKAMPTINVGTIIVYNNFIPSSEDLCLKAFSSFSKKTFEDIAYFEPKYTKTFYTTQSK